MKRLRGGLGLLFGLSACAGAATSPAQRAEAETPTRVVEAQRDVTEDVALRPTVLNLEHASPQDVLVMAQGLVEKSVLVEATALPSLRCMDVTVVHTTPLTRQAAAEMLFAALRPKGLRVERIKDTWVVSVDDMHPPLACTEPEAPTLVGEPKSETQATSPSTSDAGIDEAQQELLRSITAVSTTEAVISRRGMDLALANHARIFSGTRAVPEQENGKVIGVRLFGVKADSELGRIGLENGDRLERVMGKSMSSPDQALAAYVAMRSAREIELVVNRRGRTVRLTVHVR